MSAEASVFDESGMNKSVFITERTFKIFSRLFLHRLCVYVLYNLCTGCVGRNESSEEWLMKNFGAFRAMARMKDFSALNMVFSGVS